MSVEMWDSVYFWNTLFCNEAQYERRGVTDSLNIHLRSLSNPRYAIASKFLHGFVANVWCALTDKQLQ
jgi:hypothetical protein